LISCRPVEDFNDASTIFECVIQTNPLKVEVFQGRFWNIPFKFLEFPDGIGNFPSPGGDSGWRIGGLPGWVVSIPRRIGDIAARIGIVPARTVIIPRRIEDPVGVNGRSPDQARRFPDQVFSFE
jgi:hypothetical protein